MIELDLEQLYDLWRCGACVGACDAYMPRSEAVAALLGQFETRWFYEQVGVLPAVAPEPIAAFGDEHDPRLLRDEIPGWLLALPPIAFGIAPLPPHTGHGGNE